MVCMPTYINPRWERFLAGGRIDEIDFYSLRFARQVLISPSFVQYNRSNPRSVEYMLNLAAILLNEHAPDAEVDLLVDSNAFQQVPEKFRPNVKNVWKVEHEGLWKINRELKSKLKTRQFDTVLLAYPDAIGLGWSSIERSLFFLKAQNLLVLNGRHRCFVLDQESRSKLLWRRLVGRSWIVEVFLSLGLVVLSIPLAIYDSAIGKRIKRQAYR